MFGWLHIRRLRSRDANVRQRAAVVLGSYPGHQTEVAIESVLGDPVGAVRIAAAHSLATIEPARAAKRLVSMLTDSTPEVRRAVAQTLGTLGYIAPTDTARAQLAIAAEDWKAVTRLGLPALLVALQFPSDEIQVRAAAALGEISDPRIVEPLLALADSRFSLLRSKESEVRREALAALGRRLDVALEPLKRLLCDPKFGYVAQEALTRSGDPRVARHFFATLPTVESGQTSHLLEALERLKWRPSTRAEKLTVALARNDPKALIAMGEEVVPLLVELLIAEAAGVKSRGGEGPDLDAVHAWVGKEHANPCKLAIEVLVGLGGPQATAGLMAALRELVQAKKRNPKSTCSYDWHLFRAIGEARLTDAVPLLGEMLAAGDDSKYTFDALVALGPASAETIAQYLLAAPWNSRGFQQARDALCEVADPAILARVMVGRKWSTNDMNPLRDRLAKVGPAAACPLIEALASANRDFTEGVSDAFRVLSKVVGMEHFDAALRLSSHQQFSWLIADCVCRDVSKSRHDPRVLPVLLRLVEAGEGTAGRALAAIASPTVLPRLLPLLDKSRAARAVAPAIGAIGDPRAIRPLAHAVQTFQPNVAEFLSALGQVLDAAASRADSDDLRAVATLPDQFTHSITIEAHWSYDRDRGEDYHHESSEDRSVSCRGVKELAMAELNRRGVQ